MEGLLNPSTLETLNLSNNRLPSLDVSRMPNLRRLYLDKNAINFIRGIASLKRLETLSWREQSLTAGSAFPEIQYQDCYNVHHLHLSNNTLSSFIPSTPFLNLRILEMASTGLQTLCPRFGHKFPNLRFLNLNYNAIRDLRPLVGIIRLQTLLLAGNRICRLRQTSAVFRRISSDLVEVDLRQNPLTVGFYTPQESLPRPGKQIALHTPTAAPRSQEEPQADDAESNSPSTAPSYVLPPVDRDADAQSCARLDKDTQLRRRVYEMMIVESCERLNKLDGLPVGRKQITESPDEVRERLNELGVLHPGQAHAEGSGKEMTMRRWNGDEEDEEENG